VDEGTVQPDLSGSVISERTRLRIPSRPEWVPATVELLREKACLCGACHETRAGKLVLALHEALSNAIIHGNLELSSELKERDDDAFARALAERAADPLLSSRSVTIDVDHDPDRCRWSITDEGKGVDFERYLRREPDEESLWLSSGRGIMLMRAFVDDVHFEQGGRKVTLTLFRSSTVEKRRDVRHAVQQRVQVAPIRDDGSVDWEAAYDAVTQNLSSGGAGLIQSRLSATERVLLGVEVDGRTLYVPARVKHCRAADSGVVELGCHFLLPDRSAAGADASIEQTVTTLLDRARSGPLPLEERRQHQREAYTARIEVTGLLGLGTVIGFARNLSQGGISFISTVSLPLDFCVLVLPRGEQESIRLQARIVRCVSMTPGFYDVGAKFIAVEAHG